MDMNEYVLEVVTLSRIAELRAEAAEWHRVKAATGPVTPTRPLRATLGDALIRLGRRLRAGTAHTRRDRRLGVAAGAGRHSHGAARG